MSGQWDKQPYEMGHTDFVLSLSESEIGIVIGKREASSRENDWKQLWILSQRHKLTGPHLSQLAREWDRSYPDPRGRTNFGGTSHVMIQQVKTSLQANGGLTTEEIRQQNTEYAKLIDSRLTGNSQVVCMFSSNGLHLEGKVGVSPRKLTLKLDLLPGAFQRQASAFLEMFLGKECEILHMEELEPSKRAPSRERWTREPELPSQKEEKSCLETSSTLLQSLLEDYGEDLVSPQMNPHLMFVKISGPLMVFNYGLRRSTVIPVADGLSPLRDEAQKWRTAFLQSQSRSSSSLASQSPGNALV